MIHAINRKPVADLLKTWFWPLIPVLVSLLTPDLNRPVPGNSYQLLFRKWKEKDMRSFSGTFQALLLVLILAGAASGVMPPDHYAGMAERSKIKASALVVSVEILETSKECTMKKVSFFLRHPFSDNVPGHFSGICSSVDWPWQSPMAGGTIYHYPEAGDKVYVTVGSDGGSITSYTYINEELETLFIANPEKIKYGMGNAWLDL